MTVVTILLLAVAGFAAGILNTLAGAASLLTLPILIFTGLDASVANATNRLAVFVQNGVAAVEYARQGTPGGRASLRLAAPAVAGALLGAWTANHTPERAMRVAIAASMVVFLVLTLAALPRLARGKDRVLAEPAWSWRLGAAFFVIGIFGGFLQVGTGILYLLCLGGLAHVHLVVANRIKVTVTLAVTVASIAVFLLHAAPIDFARGGALALGMGAGAWAATRLSLARGERVILYALSAVVVGSAIKLIWDVVG